MQNKKVAFLRSTDIRQCLPVLSYAIDRLNDEGITCRVFYETSEVSENELPCSIEILPSGVDILEIASRIASWKPDAVIPALQLCGGGRRGHAGFR